MYTMKDLTLILQELQVGMTADMVIGKLKANTVRVDSAIISPRGDGGEGFVAIYQIDNTKLHFKIYGKPSCYRLFRKESSNDSI